MIVASVPARDEEAAKEIILSAYKKRPRKLEFVKCEEAERYGFPRL
jgi:hypothetical protein